jgi:cytochrome c6
MTKVKLGLLSIGIVFAFIACNNDAPKNATSNTNTSQANAQPTPQPTPQPTQADMLAEARALYADNCAICHQPNGGGGKVTVQKKTLKAPSLKTGHAVSHGDEKLIKTITDGEEEMPSFKDELTAEQIKSLVQFIRKEFQSGAPK